MGWQDRIAQAAYTAPSGERVEFQFEDVSRSLDLRGTAYGFTDTDGTYIQRTGKSGQTFPLRIFISGDNYDIEADNFFTLLGEAGTGILEHPRYGTRNVVPLGSLRQRDDLKTAGNQAIFEMTFWETLGTLYPSGDLDPAGQAIESISVATVAAAEEFEKDVINDGEFDRTTLANNVDNLIQSVRVRLAPVASTVEDVKDQFDAIYDSINTSIDVLVGQPLTLSSQIAQLAQSPARSVALWDAKLMAYSDLAAGIFSSIPVNRGNDNSARNKFSADNTTARGIVTGAALGAVNNTFETRPEALKAAQELLLLLDDLTVWQEQSIANLSAEGDNAASNVAARNLVDTGEAYQKLQQSIALTSGFLIQISFSLAQERIITLDRQRTIIDLTAELYGVVDSKLDFLINTNNLNGDEIIELPAGRVIKYYV